jgi:DNA repair photolyase
MAEELGNGERKLEGGNIATVTKSLLFTRHIKHLKKMRVQP